MIADREAAFKFTLGTEGLLSLLTSDGGNYASGVAGVGPLIGSKYGVSAAQLAAYLNPIVVTAPVMAAITPITAEAIFMPGYWSSLRCDDLAAGLDLMVCDHGYNRGTHPSARVLQRLCGTRQDGWLGDKTVKAANSWVETATAPALSADTTRRLQTRLRVVSDGIIGRQTRAALSAALFGHTMLALCLLAEAQLNDYRTLNLFGLYGRGWTNRVWNRLGAGLALLSD